MAQEEKEALAFLKNKGWVLPQEKVIEEVDKKSDALKLLESKGWLPVPLPPPVVPPEEPMVTPPVKPPFNLPQSIAPTIEELDKPSFLKIIGETLGGAAQDAADTIYGTIEAAQALITGIPSFLAGVGAQAGLNLFEYMAEPLGKSFKDAEGEDIEGLTMKDFLDSAIERLGRNKSVKEKIATLGTYVPQTEMGQGIVEGILYPVSLFFSGVEEVAEMYSDDPGVQDGIKFLGEIGFVYGVPAVKGFFTKHAKAAKPITVKQVENLAVDISKSKAVPAKIKAEAKLVAKGKSTGAYPFFPKDAPQIWRDAMDVTSGKGIRPFKDPAVKGKFIELEEYQQGVPRVLRRKGGYAPDVVADMLGFDYVGDFYKALEWSGKKPELVKPADVIEAEAKAFNEAFEGIQKDALLEEIARERELQAERALEVREEKPALKVKPERRKDFVAREIFDRWEKGKEIPPEERAFIGETYYRDSMTGLKNKRAYNESPKSAAEAVIDLDNLKKINDTLGHEAGNKAIREAGEALASHEESFRVGGDEFVIKGDPKILNKALPEIEQTLKKQGIDISWGVGKTFKEADAAMYKMKRGRKPALKVEEPADLFGKEIEEVKPKPEVPKAEEVKLFEPTEIEAKYPTGFDSRGIKTVPDINKAREIAQSHRDKGWILEIGQTIDKKGWIRLKEKKEPGKGKLAYNPYAKKPEFLKKGIVQYEMVEKRPKIVAQERELGKVVGEKVEIGKPPPEAIEAEASLAMTKLKNRADESFTYNEFMKAVEKKEANAMVKKAGFKSLKNFWEESQEVREYKIKPELLKKKKPEKIEVTEKEAAGVEEQLEKAGVAEEIKSGKAELSLPYKEWQKSAEGGFVSMEFGKTFGGSKKSNAYQALLDRFHAIKGLTDVLKKEGVDLPVHQDPYMNVRNYLGVQGKAETKLMYKRFSVDKEGNIRFKGESLKDILKPVKKNIDEFERYLVDRRVPELEGRGIETGRDLNAAVEFIRENRDRFEDAAGKFTEFHHSLLDELVEAGFMTKEKGKIIKDHNQMYAPFNRVVEDLNNYGYIPSSNKLLSKVTSPLKRIKGSERAIISPLESTIKATYSITSVIERNRIANMIIDMRKMSPELARTIKPVKPQMVVVATLKDGTKVYRPSTYQKAGVIEVLTKGKRHFYEVPPDLYEAMSQLTEVGHNWLVKILAAPARILRTGATTTPEFAFRNPVRDNWFAFVNAKYGFIPGWDFAKGMFSFVKKPELYWKWKAAGGEWSMLVTLDRAGNQATLKNVLGVKDYKKYIKNPISFLEEVSRYGEMPTRLGVFERAQGKASDLEAAFESREGSIDFARRGAKTKTVSALYTFANARLQGLDKFARTFKEAPVKTSAKIMAVAVIPSIINYLTNRDDPTYWEIPQWQRDMFWIIPIKRGKTKVKTVLKEEEKEARKGKKGVYLRIPKGDVGVIFGTTVEKILEWIDKEKEGRAELDKLAISIIKETLPISDIGGFLPVAFRVPVEIMTNQKFFYDRPIVPEGKQKLERKYQHSPFTSESAKAVGKIFNISPSKVEHLVTGYGAGLARHALKLADGVLAEMGILPKKAEIPKELADLPGVAAFAVRDPIGFGSESVQRFYETLDKFERYEATSKMMKDKKMGKERIAWAKKHAAEFLASERKLVTDFRRARQDLSSLRKMKEKVLANKEITVEQKEQITDDIHGLVMATVISLLSQYRALEQIADKRKKK